MKRYFIFSVPIILFLFAVQINAQNQSKVDYPGVPRVSAYEAYVKYKDGKAIIFHGGGEHYSKRHIMGSFNLDVKNRDEILARFPKEGIEIFTYCY